ncbi:magnesium/cobalt transporter CorA [Jiella sp. MQZ9-1]|uniref:Magnesium transport protein CorA n=1 Tax=Jiella flava TaxID=2816857 RepID=A0A939FXB5_9HYPH|nr:magnesium/cobalt transporter CorA [Jiella flava]MBO0661946.1 magnesium/cobalt transporter CorA [Jiella flava]MCD2470726.1 magnesium/cobalt transporter CorA [Jiella flava]
MIDLTGHNKRKRKREAAKRSAIGAPPGQLVADPQASQSRLTAIGLGDGAAKRLEGCTLVEALALRETCPKLWLDCTGLADIALVEQIGAAFGLHPLALEDVVNTDQRPKCEVYETYAFVVLRMLAGGEGEQLALFFGTGFVVTFQERAGDAFAPVRKRIDKGAPRLSSGGADYLAYALIDAVVDAYFPVVDGHGTRLDTIEDAIFGDIDAVQVPELHAMRRELFVMRRYLRPTRDALSAILRLDRPFLTTETKIYFADVQDHCDQLVDLNDTYRETASGLIDLHMTLSAAKTNEVINLLTIVSTIFIPLSFLAGVWGMNFDPSKSVWNMPLTQSPIGYPIALTMMAVIAGGLLLFFRRKRWI